MNSRKGSDKLYHSLTGIDDRFIEEIMEVSNHGFRVKKRKIRYLIPLAACFVLIFFTCSVLAETNFGTQIIDMFTSRSYGGDYRESGYDLLVNVQKFSISQLGDVRQISNTIKEQVKTYEPWSSRHPCSWSKEYASSEEAIAFIGLSTLQIPDMELKEERTTLVVLGNEKGQLNFVQTETDYVSGEIQMQAFANIYLKGYAKEITHEVRTIENVSFTEEYYTTAKEIQCHILTSTALESGFCCMDGYLVKDGILYSLNISYPKQELKQAGEWMRRWADSF